MAGIGDYVHYRREQYEKFGINKKSGRNDISTVLLEQHRLLWGAKSNYYSSDQLKGLSEYFSAIYYGDILTQPIKLKDTNDLLENTLLKTITKIIQEERGENWTEEDVYKALSSPNDALIKNTGFTGKRIEENKTGVTVGTVKKALNGLQNAREKVADLANRQFGSMNGKVTIAGIEMSQKELVQQINYLCNILEAAIGGRSDSKLVNFSAVDEKRAKIYKLNNGQEIPNFKWLLIYIQEILKVYQGSGVFQIAGDSSELAGLARVVYENSIKNETNITSEQLIQGIYKGWMGNTSPTQKFSNSLNSLVLSNLTVSDLNDNSNLGSYSQYRNHNNTWDLTYTPRTNESGKGTIDITLSPEFGTNLGNILGVTQDFQTTLNASLKNYSNIKTHGITLLQDSPLMNLLLTDNFTESFVNHYLNLIGSRPYKNNFDYTTANEFVKWGAAWRGFTGFYHKNEVLIVNDKTSKMVYVSDSAEFSKKLALNFRKLDKILSVSGIPPRDKEEIGFSPNTNKADFNYWVVNTGGKGDRYVAAGVRITNFILALRKVKITVSLKPNYFNNLKFAKE